MRAAASMGGIPSGVVMKYFHDNFAKAWSSQVGKWRERDAPRVAAGWEALQRLHFGARKELNSHMLGGDCKELPIGRKGQLRDATSGHPRQRGMFGSV